MKKRMLSLLLCSAMCAGLLSGCGNASSAEVLNVYNWGEYIDTDLIDQFEEETGIKVIYNTFDSNENLYSRIHPDHELRRHYPVRLRDFALYRRGYAPAAQLRSYSEYEAD